MVNPNSHCLLYLLNYLHIPVGRYMKISVGFMCPQPEAAKSLCRYVHCTLTHSFASTHSMGVEPVVAFYLSLSLTTFTPYTQLIGRAAT